MVADLRLALRLLARSPAYVLVVVITLGLGIGGATAVFTLADPMIVRPLPWEDAGRIVVLRPSVNGAETWTYTDDFVTISQHARSLEDVSTDGGLAFASVPNEPKPVLGGGISREFLHLTGLHPALGRAFTPDEYSRTDSDTPVVAMLSWAFWQRAFGGRTDVIGTRLDLAPPQTGSVDIVGVLPREFFYPNPANQAPGFIVPIRLDPRYLGQTNFIPPVIARVRPGFTFAQAESEVTRILADVDRANPSFVQGRQAHLVPLQDVLFSGMRTPLLLLFIATGCLLLLACVNLAHMAQARARMRARDLTVRLALGASRWRVVRLLAADAALLSVGGAWVGVITGDLLFSWGIGYTPTFGHIYRLLPAGLNTRVALFATLLAAVGMLALTVWPAWRASHVNLRTALSSNQDARRGWRLGGEALAIAGQTAFAVGLVVTCLLVVRSFEQLVSKDRGFDPAHVQLANMQMPPAATPEVSVARYRQLLDALGRVPGVASVGVGNGVPALTVPGGALNAAGEPISDVLAYEVTQQFPATMAMHLAQGRVFTDAEAFSGARVAVVNRLAADALWPGQAALGQTVRLRGDRKLTVVGVMDAVHWSFADTSRPIGTVFATFDTSSPRFNNLMVILRLDSERPANASQISAAATHAVPGMKWSGTAGLASWDRFIGQPRFLAASLGVLAGLTALLAGFGVLGVVSYLVSRRTREIGIRMALGADTARVRRLVVRQTLVPAAIGTAAGLAFAFWWSTSVRAVLVGIGPHDPWSFGIAAGATLVTALLASARPAVRASRIDPAVTLRAE